MNWNYDSETNNACIVTDNGMSLKFLFEEDGTVLCVSNNETDFYYNTETANRMFVLIGGEYHTISGLIQQAENEHENMVSEANEESEIEKQYKSDVSSLELTGRV